MSRPHQGAPVQETEPTASTALGAAKRALVGRPLAGEEMEETLLPKVLALPIFASDALSSVAYATEAALAVLIAASLTSAHIVVPISAAVAVLLAIVAVSYTQTVKAYKTSGGSYVVAKDNLGTLAGLVTSSALMIDYVLTVAVSVSAGVLAITSAAPSLHGAKVEMALGAIIVLTVANLRGLRESGLVFALPTYGFIASLYVMLAVAIGKCAGGTCPAAHVPHPAAVGVAGGVGVFVVLRAFASGASALTGVEAISNGVSAFRRPQARNAARTLAILAVIAITLFLGVSVLASKMHARPSETTSVLSQIARAAFPAHAGGAFMYYVVQGFTFAVLVLAANTSFAGFPRLVALVARDKFAPTQFVNLGDRLVYSNGILVLAGLAAALVAAFGADVNALIHLYVVGVFTAFTLSQAGMVLYWRRERTRGWRVRAAINATGAAATAVVMAVVIATKFLEGAWAVIVTIPIMVGIGYAIRRHYRRLARRLQAGTAAVIAAPPATNTVVLYVDHFDDAARRAVWYAAQVCPDGYRPIHVPPRRDAPLDLQDAWASFAPPGSPPLEVLDPAEGRTAAVLDYVWSLPRGESQFVTVVIAERFAHRRLVEELAHRVEVSLKIRLLGEPGIAITDVTALADEPDPHSVPSRPVCRVLISSGPAATMRAIRYARTLDIPDTRAIAFPFDDEDAQRIESEWRERGIDLPLDVSAAPYRDISDPVRRSLREITADPTATAVVVMPEICVPTFQRVLHNQDALYLKRILLFEPRVILTCVPYHVR